jgi:hypothetical protein
MLSQVKSLGVMPVFPISRDVLDATECDSFSAHLYVVCDYNDDHDICNIHYSMANEEVDFVAQSRSLGEIEEGDRTTPRRNSSRHGTKRSRSRYPDTQGGDRSRSRSNRAANDEGEDFVK